MTSLDAEIRNTIRIRQRRYIRSLIAPIFELERQRLKADPFFEIIIQRPDEQVIAGIGNMDNDTYKYLYGHIIPLIKKRLLKNDKNADVHDIFQETITDIIILSQKGKLKITKSVDSYIVTVAVNKWNKAFSKYLKNRTIPLDEGIEINPYDDSEEETDNFDVVSGWLDRLSDTCKKLINEFYWNKSSWKIIAENEGYSNAKSARNQKSKCMEVLKVKLRSKDFNL